VNCPPVDRERSLLEGFAQGRVGVAGARDVLGRGPEFLGEGGFGDQGSGIGADDVDTEHPVGLALGQDLDEAFGIAVGAGTGVGGERELAGAVGDPRRLEFLLGVADGSNLGPSVDDGWDRVVIDA